jgi:uncharacterized protein (DUF1810 family)
VSDTLERFVAAQASVYDDVVAELRQGRKTSHWMWFIFPQLRGLGHSPTAQFYAISSLGEARAYLEHPLLGQRLRQSIGALLEWAGRRSPEQLLGSVDSVKLRSSLTLFEAASGDPMFGHALDEFFGGERDERTLALLNSAR